MENIEVQAAKALYEKRMQALKSRFADKYSDFLHKNKGDERISENQLIDYALRLVKDVEEAKEHLMEVSVVPK